MCASYLQIYNKVISDLLRPERHPMQPDCKQPPCRLNSESCTTCSKYLVRASYLQIYNEVISDLLRPERTNLSIREDRRRGVFVEGLSEWVVRSPGEVYQLMSQGQAMVSGKSDVMGPGAVPVYGRLPGWVVHSPVEVYQLMKQGQAMVSNKSDGWGSGVVPVYGRLSDWVRGPQPQRSVTGPGHRE